MQLFSVPAGIIFGARDVVLVSTHKQTSIPYTTIRFPLSSRNTQEGYGSLEDVSLQTSVETLVPIVSHALSYLEPRPTLVRRPLLFVAVSSAHGEHDLPLDRLSYLTGCSAIIPIASGFLAGLGIGADLRSAKPTWLFCTGKSETELCLLQHGVVQAGWAVPCSTSHLTKRFVALIQERYLTWVDPDEALARLLSWAGSNKQEGFTLGGFKQGEARRKRVILTGEDVSAFWESEKTLLVHALEQTFQQLEPALRSDLYTQGIVMAGEDQALFDLLIPTLTHQFELPVCFLPGTEHCVADGMQKILAYSNFFQEEFPNGYGSIRGYKQL